MILAGTLVNAAGVLAGGGAGLALHRLMHRGIPERFSELIMKGIGLCTVYIAFGHLLDGSKTLDDNMDEWNAAWTNAQNTYGALS